MTELEEIFAELGISQYLKDFIDQGFDTWETILDIKETDFDALNVKLGHRRKIQRRIASSRGLSSDRALESPGYSGADGGDDPKIAGFRNDGKDVAPNAGSQGAKRKYRRHPKTDENAPERPPSAYVIFSNKMREDLKGRNLSFTEIAKLVGEHWQNLAPPDKEPFETQASVAKERYLSELSEYKKTDSYRDYTQYLAEFKARQQNQQSVNDLDPAKRPRLEPQQSTNSTGTMSSGTSQFGVETPPSQRENSINPNPNTNVSWLSKDQQNSPQPVSASAQSHGLGSSRVTEPAAATSPVLPGYRDAMYGSGHPSLAWRDTHRDEASPNFPGPPHMSSVDRRPDLGRALHVEPINSSIIVQSHIPPLPQQPPPLLKSESTNSTVSSQYFTPRTPLETPIDRGLSLPPIYAQKTSGPYDHQLPPLRPSSISPQTTISGSMQSPNVINHNADFAPRPGVRAYGITPALQPSQGEVQPEYISPHPSDEALDPVSALLRAGEIVNRNSRHHL